MNYSQTIHVGPIEYKGDILNSMVTYYRTGNLCFIAQVFFLDSKDGKAYDLPFDVDEIAEIIQGEEPETEIIC